MVCLIRDGYFAGQEAPFSAWMDSLKKYDALIIEKARRNGSQST